jgi:acyl carrier protein
MRDLFASGPPAEGIVHATNVVQEQVRRFILDYAQSRAISGVFDDESLFRNNVLDSFGAFRLIVFIENAFHMTVDDVDVDPENFQTINAICRFVTGKIGANCAQAAAAS